MKWFSAVVVVVLVGLLPSVAYEAATTNAITYDPTQPTSPAGGKVLATGSYTLARGYSLVGIELDAAPAGGGRGGTVSCMHDDQTNSWSGAIAGLPAGTYNVQARMNVRKDKLNQIVFTPVVRVTVAAP
jgi:hypothetical protein